MHKKCTPTRTLCPAVLRALRAAPEPRRPRRALHREVPSGRRALPEVARRWRPGGVPPAPHRGVPGRVALGRQPEAGHRPGAHHGPEELLPVPGGGGRGRDSDSVSSRRVRARTAARLPALQRADATRPEAHTQQGAASPPGSKGCRRHGGGEGLGLPPLRHPTPRTGAITARAAAAERNREPPQQGATRTRHVRRRVALRGNKRTRSESRSPPRRSLSRSRRTTMVAGPLPIVRWTTQALAPQSPRHWRRGGRRRSRGDPTVQSAGTVPATT
jgi:hypothetical protein